MTNLRDAVDRRRMGQDVWFILRVIRYEIWYLLPNCASHTQDMEEALATYDREQAFALAKQTHGLVLRFPR